MIQIVNAKNGFMVVSVSKGGEPLRTSEILNSKQSCWKNIVSELKNCYGGDRVWALVQDSTKKVPVVYSVGPKRVVMNNVKPQKIYVVKSKR